jgi:hypothetical protein
VLNKSVEMNFAQLQIVEEIAPLKRKKTVKDVFSIHRAIRLANGQWKN